MIFYTGSYTQMGSPAPDPKGQGIGCFNLDAKSGKVELLHYTKQRNPSYLAISNDKKYLYAIEEMYEQLNPEIFSYRIENDGKLSLINTQKLIGDYACHLAIIKDRLLVANYMSGNVLSFPILKDGSLMKHHQLIQHAGTGPNTERQEAAHAHMVYPFCENQVFIVDLGIDTARSYRWDETIMRWEADPNMDIQTDSGAGARHMVMCGTEDLVYVLSELAGDVFVFKKQGSKFNQIQKISFIPERYSGDFGGAAIRLHPNGHFLYVSCRGSDSIAVFKINDDPKTLSLVAQESSGGKTPRDFNIDPTGNWLVVANQDSDALVVFEIDQEKGILKKRSAISAETPVNICWLAQEENKI